MAAVGKEEGAEGAGKTCWRQREGSRVGKKTWEGHGSTGVEARHSAGPQEGEEIEVR